MFRRGSKMVSRQTGLAFCFALHRRAGQSREMSCFVYEKQIIDVVDELSHEFFRPKFQLEFVIAPQCRLEITLIKIERYFVGTQD
jgi:hypothetical protein